MQRLIDGARALGFNLTNARWTSSRPTIENWWTGTIAVTSRAIVDYEEVQTKHSSIRLRRHSLSKRTDGLTDLKLIERRHGVAVFRHPSQAFCCRLRLTAAEATRKRTVFLEHYQGQS